MMDVLTVGETMVMVTPMRPEPLTDASEFRLDIGGAESNVASHLVRRGVAAGWAGAVGDDTLGQRLLATLAGRGVDTSLAVVDPTAPTGVYFKDPGPDGTRVLYYRRGSAAANLGPDFAERLPLATVPLVHISGITAALSSSCRALLDALVDARLAAEREISFDVNYRGGLWSTVEAAPVLLDLARRCDIVFVGLDEATVLWSTTSAADVADFVNVRTIVVKDGSHGAYVFHDGRSSFVAAEPVDVVEPVGAGDAFAAGYLAAHLAGAPPNDALLDGHRAAAAALLTTTDF